ncbi:MAG: glycosyltransferase family 2 protein [Bacteroidota bacterium]|nr:glycosyltransferase family 2 protein [Bacteroidota bacterium]
MVDNNQQPEQKQNTEVPVEQPRQQNQQRPQRRRYRPHYSQERKEARKEAPQAPRQQLYISVVIPLYNERDSLKELYDKLHNTLISMNSKYEIVFVDDGSTDDSARVLKEIRQKDNRVKVIIFRRNYGKSAALSAGFEHAKGDIIITMDADLQDDPAEIPNLTNALLKGVDLVSGWKKKRRDPITKTIPSRFFNFVTSLFTGIKIHDFNCGLKAYKKDVVKEINIYGELHRYIPALAHWKGFSVGEIPVQHNPRKYGKTKFGFGRFWKGFLDLITMLFTTRYLQRPLHLFGFWGMIFAFAGFAIDAWLVVEWIRGLTALSNRPLFLGGVLLMIVGIQFISIGLIGEMITKTRASKEEFSIKEFWK